MHLVLRLSMMVLNLDLQLIQNHICAVFLLSKKKLNLKIHITIIHFVLLKEKLFTEQSSLFPQRRINNDISQMRQ